MTRIGVQQRACGTAVEHRWESGGTVVFLGACSRDSVQTTWGFVCLCQNLKAQNWKHTASSNLHWGLYVSAEVTTVTAPVSRFT
jgi:hypothetical protein